MKIFKQQKNNFIIFLCFVFIFLIGIKINASGTSNFKIEILALCGNHKKEAGEQCDNLDLGGKSCQTLGYSRGNLTCNVNCTYNTSECISSSGGGGSSGTDNIRPITNIIFNGRAYPKSFVTILKDAQIVATTIADSNAEFYVNISDLAGGTYIFSIYSEDNRNNRSPMIAFPVSITSGTITQISNIFLAPIIAIDKSEVKKGEYIAIFGQSAPNSEITIVINSQQEIFTKTLADKNGVYLYNFDTTPLEIGQHLAKSKSSINNEVSAFSKTISFIVDENNILSNRSEKIMSGDLNNDKRINFIDFSIAAYWYKRTLSEEFKKIEKEFLNGDGKIDLIDFSILAFYWTG